MTTVKLADGSVAKVYEVGADRFEAGVFAGSTKLGTLVSKGAPRRTGRTTGSTSSSGRTGP